MSKFKVGDYVVRVGDKLSITLHEQPTGSVLQIGSCIGIIDPTRGEYYTSNNRTRYYISDCDFELLEEEN